MQQMVDDSLDLQSLFNDLDPNVIATKLVNGMKAITDVVVDKTRIQIKNRGVKFWSRELEDEREHVKRMKKRAINSGNIEDRRNFKHIKNRHIKSIRKHQK